MNTSTACPTCGRLDYPHVCRWDYADAVTLIAHDQQGRVIYAGYWIDAGTDTEPGDDREEGTRE